MEGQEKLNENPFNQAKRHTAYLKDRVDTLERMNKAGNADSKAIETYIADTIRRLESLREALDQMEESK